MGWWGRWLLLLAALLLLGTVSFRHLPGEGAVVEEAKQEGGSVSLSALGFDVGQHPKQVPGRDPEAAYDRAMTAFTVMVFTSASLGILLAFKQRT